MERAFAAAVAAVCGLCVFCGCSREEPPRSEPESYMKDSAFLKELEGLRRRKGECVAAHQKLAAEMRAIIEAKKKELKTEDLEKVRQALEKSEKWKTLHSRCQDAATAVKETSRKIEKTVRKRISKQES